MVYQASAHHYIVLSDSGMWYYVTHADGRSVCTCPDFKYRGTECKHIRMAGQAPEPAERGEPFIIMPVPAGTCPKCGAAGAVKRGLRRNKYGSIQRYQCRNCGLRFSDNLGFEWQHADRETVTNAIHLHYDGGMSSRQIQQYFARNGIRFSHVAIRNWINKYTRLAAEYLESIPVQVGERWDADELYVNAGGGGRGGEVLLMMSHRERFILAHAESDTYKAGDGPERLLEKARKRAGHKPKLMTTDGRSGFRTAHRKNYAMGPDGRTSGHLSETHLRGQRCNNNAMERLNGTIRDYLLTIRRAGKVTAETIWGYIIYYNFFRPHMGLDGSTPAEMAGILIGGAADKLLTVIQNAARHARRAKGPPGA